MIGIIAATNVEIKIIIKNIKNKVCHTISKIKFVMGEIGKYSVVVAVSGVGKVNAALCTEAIIMAYRPNQILNIGVAGSTVHKVGTVVVGGCFTFFDLDTTALGEPLGLIQKINKTYMCVKNKQNKIINGILNACKKDYNVLKIQTGGYFATGDSFINVINHKRFIGDKKIDAVDMESAAIMQVCRLNDIELNSIKVISDNLNGNEYNMSYKFLSNLLNKKVVEAFNDWKENRKRHKEIFKNG